VVLSVQVLLHPQVIRRESKKVNKLRLHRLNERRKESESENAKKSYSGKKIERRIVVESLRWNVIERASQKVKEIVEEIEPKILQLRILVGQRVPLLLSEAVMQPRRRGELPKDQLRARII
jgi:hypothetical protein